MEKYNTDQLFPELDMDHGHYKKWFIHLEPIEGLSESEIFNRDDTVAEIRIIEFHDDATNKAYDYYVFYYLRHDQGECRTIFEGTCKSTSKEYKDVTQAGASIYDHLHNKCMEKLKEYLNKQ